MTLADAQAQLDGMLQNMGISRAQYQGRSFDFPVGEQRLKELAYLEGKIQKLTDDQNNTGSTRCTYGSFSRD